ncbi:MAG: HlyD family type I secretion periplasmic adaptor subunit [Rickettsiales bacterium]
MKQLIKEIQDYSSKIKKHSKKRRNEFIKQINKYPKKTNKFIIKKFAYLFPKTKKYIDKKCEEISILFDQYLKLEENQIGLKPVKYGIYIITVFFFIFFVWAGFMPINSSSIAPGTVVLDFNRKIIQHLEGGIIQEIMVKEGQEVVTGSNLVILQNIQAQAQQSVVQKQLLTSKAIYNRLVKEQSYGEELDLSSIEDQGKKIGYKEIAELIKTQYNIYDIKKESYFGKIDILKKRISQLEKEIEALEAQEEATNSQLRILANELEMTKKMVSMRNIPVTEQLNLEKQIAELQGKKGSLIASIAKSEQSISETNLEIVNFSKEHLNSVLAEMQEVESKISGLTEQLTSTSDVLKRTVIKSPTSGIVMDLKFHTKGAVIPPGGEIMNIVPQDEELIIEAKINPKDIDVVKQGLKAKINLSAFKAKKVPKLDGILMSVSADILLDEITGENFFLGRIKIADDSLKSLKETIQLYPGMPAEVYIITGSRTLLQYLVSPLKDATYKAFRED